MKCFKSLPLIKKNSGKLALILVAMTLSACGQTPKPATQFDVSHLFNTRWELQKIDGQSIDVTALRERPAIEFSDEETAAGHAGCNHFFGPIEIGKDSISIKHIAMTRMMCGTAAMTVENAVADTLSFESEVQFDGDTLYLRNSRHILEYQQVPVSD